MDRCRTLRLGGLILIKLITFANVIVSCKSTTKTTEVYYLSDQIIYKNNINFSKILDLLSVELFKIILGDTYVILVFLDKKTSSSILEEILQVVRLSPEIIFRSVRSYIMHH